MGTGYKIVGDHVELTEKPKSYKKITGTRFATILGLNKWSTPFEAWCAITRVYEKPFEETESTRAGKVIESKIIKYLQDVMFMELETPEDVYGKDFFKKTWGDFFPNIEIFGGMWDARGEDVIVEVKTTKRPEDWELDVPLYYKTQAAEYAYFSNRNNIIVPVAFLTEKDLQNPEAFVPSVDNTKIYEFTLDEAFPTFKESYVDEAEKWWNEHVVAGVSPAFDEKRDAEILKALRKNTVDATEEEPDLRALMIDADNLKANIDAVKKALEPEEKRLKEIDGMVKSYMMKKFRAGDDHVEMEGAKYIWTLGKTEKKDIDKKAVELLMSKEGISEDMYTVTKEVYTLRKKAL